MLTAHLVRLAGQNLRRNRKNLAFASVGIVVGISSFVFFIALGAGVQRVVSTQIFPMEANRLQVVPRSIEFGGAVGGRPIDEQALSDFAAIPGVAAVYPRMRLAFLASTAVDGRDISPSAVEMLRRVPGVTARMLEAVRDVRVWLEIMGDGIDPRLAGADAVAGEFADPAEGEPIPVLLSRRMIEIYNGSFAEARGLPKISEMLLPFLPPIPLTLNHSFISREVRGAPLQARMKVVGLSRHALMGGITMPLETARRMNRRFAGEAAAHTYSSAVLEVASSDWLGPVQERLRQLGFDLDMSEKRMAESVGMFITLVTLGFSLISLIIVGIAAVSIAHTFFMILYERKREIGLLRALGASRGDVRNLILTEASAIGMAAGTAGLLLGALACLLSDALLSRFLPDFPFKPESFFAFPGWIFPGALLFALIFCWLGALVPARRAAALDPAATLTGR